MAIMTRKDLKEMEKYYYWARYKQWYPFPKELQTKILSVYGQEPSSQYWIEQDIYEGSRKIIFDYFEIS